jgi:TPP-dependent pyruvate/acetoin dehydrogenase alpha subunit
VVISTPQQAQRRQAPAGIGAAVIGQPSSEQISATVTGLGSGATNTGTVNVPIHAAAC